MKEGKIQAHWFRTNVAIYSDEQRLSNKTKLRATLFVKLPAHRHLADKANINQCFDGY